MGQLAMLGRVALGVWAAARLGVASISGKWVECGKVACPMLHNFYLCVDYVLRNLNCRTYGLAATRYSKMATGFNNA